MVVGTQGKNKPINNTRPLNGYQRALKVVHLTSSLIDGVLDTAAQLTGLMSSRVNIQGTG